MRFPLRAQPKTLTGQAGAAIGDVVSFARSVPGRLDSGRAKALAVAGGAASAAAGFAFWRSRHDERPSVHRDPAKPPAPWKRPASDDGKAAVANVAGASK